MAELPSNKELYDEDELRNFLIEILAFTFKANMSDLLMALSKDVPIPNPPSILTAEQKGTLAELAHSIRVLETGLQERRWDKVPSDTITRIITCIVAPANRIGVDSDYALALIASYADHRCLPAKAKKTLVSRHKPRLLRLSRHFCTKKFTETLQWHQQVGQQASHNDYVQLILDRALTRFTSKFGIKLPEHTGSRPSVEPGITKVAVKLSVLMSNLSYERTREFLRRSDSMSEDTRGKQ